MQKINDILTDAYNEGKIDKYTIKTSSQIDETEERELFNIGLQSASIATLKSKGLGFLLSTKEGVALASLAYTPSLIGFNITGALKSMDRAEAFSQIRYFSNGDKSSGQAKRRYFESERFGLYDNNGQATLRGSIDFLASYLRHQDQIRAYDRQFGGQIDQAHKDYGTYQIDANSIETTNKLLSDALQTLLQNNLNVFKIIDNNKNNISVDDALNDFKFDNIFADYRTGDNDTVSRNNLDLKSLGVQSASNLILGVGDNLNLVGNDSGDQTKNVFYLDGQCGAITVNGGKENQSKDDITQDTASNVVILASQKDGGANCKTKIDITNGHNTYIRAQDPMAGNDRVTYRIARAVCV